MKDKKIQKLTADERYIIGMTLSHIREEIKDPMSSNKGYMTHLVTVAVNNVMTVKCSPDITAAEIEIVDERVCTIIAMGVAMLPGEFDLPGILNACDITLETYTELTACL